MACSLSLTLSRPSLWATGSSAFASVPVMNQRFQMSRDAQPAPSTTTMMHGTMIVLAIDDGFILSSRQRNGNHGAMKQITMRDERWANADQMRSAQSISREG